MTIITTTVTTEYESSRSRMEVIKMWRYAALVYVLATTATLCGATCTGSQTVFYPGEALTGAEIVAEEANAMCKLQLNIPECNNEFNVGCCGGAESYCRTNSLNRDACMACLAPLQREEPRIDVCADYASITACFAVQTLLLNDCLLEPRLQAVVQDHVEVYAVLCAFPLCDVSSAYSCVNDLLENQTGPFCSSTADVRLCFEQNGCPSHSFLLATSSQDPARFGLCSISNIPANCTAISVFQSPEDPYVGFGDGSCSIELNTPECLYDNGDCCSGAVDACIDPSDAVNFDQAAADCMQCLTNASRFDAGICPWFDTVGSCLSRQSCGSVHSRFAEIISYNTLVAQGGCAEPGCNLDSVFECIENVMDVQVTPLNCLLQRSAVELCFLGSGCSNAIRDAYLSLLTELDACANTLSTCLVDRLQLPFGSNLYEPSRLGDGICDLEYNVAGCSFDGGDCCSGPDLVCSFNDQQAANCMGCLVVDPFEMLNANATLCNFYSSAGHCLAVNNCSALSDEFKQIEDDAKGLFGDLCSAIGCAVPSLVQCLAAFDLSTVIDTLALNETLCATVDIVSSCVEQTGCSQDGVLGYLGLHDPRVVSLCFCEPTVDVGIVQEGIALCEDLVFSASLNVSTSCVTALVSLFDPPPQNAYYSFNWLVEGTSPSTAALPITSVERSVRVPAYLVQSSSFTVRLVVVSTVFPEFNGTAVVEIEVSSLQNVPVVPRTSERGALSVYAGRGESASFELNGLRSCNPNVVGCKACTDDGFQGTLDLAESVDTITNRTGLSGLPFGSPEYSFRWEVNCSSPPCELAQQDGLLFTINRTQLSVEESPYVLTFVIIEDAVQEYRSAPVEIVALDGSGLASTCAPPKLSIFADRAQLSVSSTTLVQRLVISEQTRVSVLAAEADGQLIPDGQGVGLSLEWTLNGGPVIGSGEALVVTASLLEQEPEPYTFTLTAKQPCTATVDAFARIVVRVNKAPVNGTVRVIPSVGDLNTEFTVAASSFVDPEGDLPLRYAFLANGLLLNSPSLSNSFVSRLPGIGRVNVTVLVKDTFGAVGSNLIPFEVELSDRESLKADLFFRRIGARGDSDTSVINSARALLTNANDSTATKGLVDEFHTRSFEALVTAASSLRNQDLVDFESLSLQANTLRTVLGSVPVEDQNTTRRVLGFLSEQIRAARGSRINFQDGLEELFYEDVLNSAESLLLGSVSGIQAHSSASCANIDSIRALITDIGLLRTSDDPAGTFERSVNSPSVKLTVANARANRIGELGFDGFNGSLPNSPVSVESTKLVTTLVGRFELNIRVCDDEAFTDFLGSAEECDDLIDRVPENYAGPLAPVANVVSLEFRQPFDQGGAIVFEPTDLEDPIVLSLPTAGLDRLQENCSNFTRLTCGFFDTIAKQYSTEGCEVVAIDVVAGEVVCQCNHASDYAAWVAFQEDVRNVFLGSFAEITAFAVTVSSSLVVASLLVQVICLWSGWNTDRRNAKALEHYAVGILVLNRLLLRQKQRQFFANLKELTRSDDEGGSADAVGVFGQRMKVERNDGLCIKAFNAIRYEHSLFGLSRYDPHYSRTQRVSVFMAVVFGNLFVAALAFELKDSEIDDTSIGFIIGVVLISSLAVSVPVRLIIKMFFRISGFRKGSKSERIAQLYRVSRLAETALERVLSSDADVQLIRAYKELSLTKARHRRAKDALRKERKHRWCRVCLKQRTEHKHAVEHFEYELATMTQVSPSAHLEVLETGQAYREAVQNVKDATYYAKAQWDASPPEEAITRVRLVTKQRSLIMKAAAFIADDPSPLAKSRRALCPYTCVFTAWFFLLAFYGFGAYYIVRFILSRADRAAQPGANRTENELIAVWLTSAGLGVALGYCIAEPLIAVVRYALFPYCVTSCGNVETNSDDKENDSEHGDSRDDSGKQRCGVGQNILEFASDLIETVY